MSDSVRDSSLGDSEALESSSVTCDADSVPQPSPTLPQPQPPPGPVHQGRGLKEDEESEELLQFRYQHAGLTWHQLLQELLAKEKELKKEKAANAKHMSTIADLRKKLRAANQQQRRSLKTAQTWMAKAKAKASKKGSKSGWGCQKEPVSVDNIDQRMAIQRTGGAEGTGRYLTVESRISLGLRRNLSNIATSDLGPTVLDDATRWTVARSEVETGAAVIAHGQSFHADMEMALQEAQEDPVLSAGVAIHCVSQDATNGGIWQKRKLIAMLLHTAYCPILPNELTFTGSWSWDIFQSLQCVGDVQPVADGTGGGSVGVCHKMLQSVGCPSVQTVVDRTRKRKLQEPGKEMSNASKKLGTASSFKQKLSWMTPNTS